MKKILLVLIFSLLTAANSFAQTQIEVKLVGYSGVEDIAGVTSESAADLTSEIGFPGSFPGSVDVDIEVKLVGIYSIENLRFSDFDSPTFTEVTGYQGQCDSGTTLSDGDTCILRIAFAASEMGYQYGDTFKMTYNYAADPDETDFDVYVKIQFTPVDTSGISESFEEKIPPIKFNDPLKQATVEGPVLVKVFNVKGQLVFMKDFKDSENVINMSTWVTGIYFIVAEYAKGYPATRKIRLCKE